jgi:hypothetical protein
MKFRFWQHFFLQIRYFILSKTVFGESIFSQNASLQNPTNIFRHLFRERLCYNLEKYDRVRGGIAMKTFKLVALEVVEDGNSVEIPLEDGLIINKESERASWLLEAYTDLSLYDYFQKIHEQSREVIVQAVITKRENDPAYFQTKIASLKKLDNHISVLFEGQLRRNRSDYSELLLDSLLEKGLGGQALLEEFRDKMKSKPKLKIKHE